MLFSLIIHIHLSLFCVFSYSNDKRKLVFPRRKSNEYEKTKPTTNCSQHNRAKCSVEDEISSRKFLKSDNTSRAPPVFKRSHSLPSGNRESTLYESIDDVLPNRPKRTRSSSQHCIQSLPSRNHSKLPKHIQHQVVISKISRESADINNSRVYVGAESAASASLSKVNPTGTQLTCTHPIPNTNTEIYETIGSFESGIGNKSGHVRLKKSSSYNEARAKPPRTLPDRSHRGTRCPKQQKPALPPKPVGHSRSIVRNSLYDLQRLRANYGESDNKTLPMPAYSFQVPMGTLSICNTRATMPRATGTNSNVYDILHLPEAVSPTQPSQTSLKSEDEVFDFQSQTLLAASSMNMNEENVIKEGLYDTLDHGFARSLRRASRDKTESWETDNKSLLHNNTDNTNKTDPKKLSYPRDEAEISTPFCQSDQDSPIYFTLEPDNLQTTLNLKW